MDDWSERRGALKIGTRYRLRQKVANRTGGAFDIGESVRLQAVAYSLYDNAHVYTFALDAGPTRSYWLYDSEPLEELLSTFEETP